MKKEKVARMSLAACAMQLAACITAHAQVRDISVVMSSGKTLLKSVSDEVMDIVLIIIGMIGMVMAIISLLNHSKGDQHSPDTFLKLGGGIVLGVLVVQFCRLLIQ